MRGRAKLVTRSSHLMGEKVNDHQWNPSAGLGQASDTPFVPVKKKGNQGSTKGKKRKELAVRQSSGNSAKAASLTKLNAAKPYACSDCGKRFKTEVAAEMHRHATHGTAAYTVGNLTRCPECGVLVGNQNMNKHRLKIHAVT